MKDYLHQAVEATRLFDRKEITVQEWIQRLLGDDYLNVFSDEYVRRAEKIFSTFIDKLEANGIEEVTDDDIVADIQKAKAELERERIKLFDEKRELRENYRWQARNELYQEKIIQAINRLEPIKISPIMDKPYERVGTTAFMAIADLHAGSTFEVKGLYGEVVNKYNYEIMQARLWKLLNDFYNDDVVYDNLVIGILGDALENILRLSSLSKLREPVLDTCIKLGAFLSEWLVEAQRKMQVPIKVISVGGNHDTQRILGSKPSFEDENLMKIVVEFMKLRLKDCPNIEIADYTDVAVENIHGTSIMLQHGEDKDLQVAMDYFANLYNIDVDEIYAGHLHRPESKSVGITELGDRTITRVGSICGVDTFAKKIRASARPSAYVALYTGDGKTWSRNYYL